MLTRLSESAHAASADEVFAVLPRLADGAEASDPLLPGWPRAADVIVQRAFALAPARLEALLQTVPPAVRTGIQLVRGRHGAASPTPTGRRC